MNETIRSYQDLEVWQKSMSLAKDIYQFTKTFPGEEKFGLVTQMRRSAVSIPSNIAEGRSRTGTGEFLHFVSIAMGSLAELETQTILGKELGFLAEDKKRHILDQLDSIGKMLRGLQKALRKRK